MNVNIGIAETDREAIAEDLSRLLADSYSLYLKTHNYHWNVTGPMFQALHAMFEEHYTELATAVDAIAERIRSLGFPAPGTYSAFAALSSVKETEGLPAALDMVRDLVEAHECVIRTGRRVAQAAGKAGDEASADLATQRLQVHEKTAWMLRSLLDE